MPGRLRLVAIAWVIALAVQASAAAAGVGSTEIAGASGEGAVTVYYPSRDEAKEIKRGPFTLQMALEGAPVRGNGRLVVISHGSGGSPWVHANLAQALVADGFIVAMPAHRGDNYKDPGTPPARRASGWPSSPRAVTARCSLPCRRASPASSATC